MSVVGGAVPASVTATGQAVASCARLFGFSAIETAGAAATVALYDGTDTSGVLLASIALAANSSDTVWLGDGVQASAVYVDVSAGAATVTVYTR